ncbi:uncharacterized protein LOC142363029 [Opisthocomus hoazin]|uniref:uncharacterized protein LOC142363029 n=1 Tax=Opisthocomus hoazin TaxID=30419 RepID=UPI003F52B3CE
MLDGISGACSHPAPPSLSPAPAAAGLQTLPGRAVPAGGTVLQAATAACDGQQHGSAAELQRRPGPAPRDLLRQGSSTRAGQEEGRQRRLAAGAGPVCPQPCRGGAAPTAAVTVGRSAAASACVVCGVRGTQFVHRAEAVAVVVVAVTVAEAVVEAAVAVTEVAVAAAVAVAEVAEAAVAAAVAVAASEAAVAAVVAVAEAAASLAGAVAAAVAEAAVAAATVAVAAVVAGAVAAAVAETAVAAATVAVAAVVAGAVAAAVAAAEAVVAVAAAVAAAVTAAAAVAVAGSPCPQCRQFRHQAGTDGLGRCHRFWRGPSPCPAVPGGRSISPCSARGRAQEGEVAFPWALGDPERAVGSRADPRRGRAQVPGSVVRSTGTGLLVWLGWAARCAGGGSAAGTASPPAEVLHPRPAGSGPFLWPQRWAAPGRAAGTGSGASSWGVRSWGFCLGTSVLRGWGARGWPGIRGRLCLPSCPPCLPSCPPCPPSCPAPSSATRCPPARLSSARGRRRRVALPCCAGCFLLQLLMPDLRSVHTQPPARAPRPSSQTGRGDVARHSRSR